MKLTKPVFVVEPSGRYRASADLSIGGGVLGQMKMGQAHAQLVATNSEIQLNNFTADIFKGRANGNARIAIGKGGTSRIAATFDRWMLPDHSPLWLAPLCPCPVEQPAQ